ncbi:MAG: M28 family peptidase [Planctomycetes bacterium]|nr:M28 family peptidase [Planctomycetota bacterium]
MRRPGGKRLRAALAAAGLGALVGVAGLPDGFGRWETDRVSLRAGVACAQPPASENVRLDSRRAYQYLVRICRIGPRPSGSAGMARQQALIAEHFSKLKAEVQFQSFEVSHPLTGASVRLQNIFVVWHPERKDRILLACHYDTRPFPDRDPYNPRGKFIGANDGASGVALLMELGHHIRQVTENSGFGVDFVFFDGEEFVFSANDKYFLGSEHFARQYRSERPKHRYSCGVLLDMIGDKRLTIYMERNSWKHARALTESIWAAARRAGVREFIPKLKYEVSDDHLPLNQIAGIPTCDIIDFDYPYWHTTRDVPTACSGASLVKVGRVLIEWIRELPPSE